MGRSALVLGRNSYYFMFCYLIGLYFWDGTSSFWDGRLFSWDGRFIFWDGRTDLLGRTVILFGTDGLFTLIVLVSIFGTDSPNNNSASPPKHFRPKTDRLRPTSSAFVPKMLSRFNGKNQCKMSCVPKPTSSVPPKNGSSQKERAFVPKLIGIPSQNLRPQI